MSARTTDAPSAAINRAVASPTPLPAPVTIATLSWRRPIGRGYVRWLAPAERAVAAHLLGASGYICAHSGEPAGAVSIAPGPRVTTAQSGHWRASSRRR